MSKFISRKLVVTLLTAVLVALNEKLGLGLSENVSLGLVGLVVAYLIAQGWVDGKDKDAKAYADRIAADS